MVHLKRFGILVVVLLNIGCDQISKEVVRQKVDTHDFIHVVNDYLILTRVENTGAMLGLGQHLPPFAKIVFLQALPILVLLFLLYRVIFHTQMYSLTVIAFAFVIGGGIGNIMDRVIRGSVTDFFQVRLGIFKTGIFNMADVSVTLGVLMILGMYIAKKDHKIM
ncbi:MAG: signal peptidase II [Flavobacteriaceae bacterium]